MQNRSKTITLRTTPLSDSLRDRLVRLALERGWVILHERDSSQFDVAVRAAEDAPSQDQSGKLAETWWLEGSWVIILPPGATAPPVRDRDLVQYLPEGGDDALWIAVIENAARVGRALASRAAGIAQLHHVSTIDALTQVYNRAHLIDVLGREFKRFQRTGQPLSCIMIDLDHFKNINDTYGHNFGDEVLVALAQLLRGSIRETDILGRYGGEEFLCLLPGADLEGARALAEKIRRAVEAKPFSQGFFTIDLTASFGVASTSQAGVGNHDQLLQWADRALYRAKQTGRNRVCCAGEEAERGEIGQDADRQLLTRNAKPILLIAHHFPSELAFFRELQANDAFEIVTVSNSEEVTRFLDQTMPTAALFQADLQPVGARDLIRRIRSRMADDYFPIAILQSLDLTLAQDVSYTAGADDILPESIGYTDFERRLHVFLRLKLLHERFAETYGRLTAARARLVKAERLSALGQMASGVAHDFNNVLSAILGRAEHLLRHQKADSPLAAELEVIRRAAADGAATIRRIQEFSRSISTLDSSVVAVADVVEDCLQLTRVRWKDEADKNGVKFNTRNEVDPQLETSANPAELREVFTNLLINALDAMPEGGEVTVRSRRIESDRRFMIEVIDTGAGMPPEVARRVFEPFFTTKQERGTGLGLSVVYGIITRLGGRIEVDGRPGRGACFKIWLNPPERKTESTPMRHVIAAPVEVTVRPAAQRLELLVVEDDRSVRELFVDVLREEGHLVMDADCGRRGIELARAHSFDAVITDLGMPDVTGWDVARSVKSRSPDTTVILISGWSDDFSQDHLISKGVDRWLSKPVSLDELFQVLRSVEPLEAKKSEESA